MVNKDDYNTQFFYYIRGPWGYKINFCEAYLPNTLYASADELWLSSPIVLTPKRKKDICQLNKVYSNAQ